MSARTIVVFGSGNAFGAYLAGAYEVMIERDVRPDWVIGASIGAITAAILAGNPPEHRLSRLRQFWSEVSIQTPPALIGHDKLRQYYNGWHAAWTALFGRPGIFQHRWPGLWSALPGAPHDIAIYDHALLRSTLDRLVDFDLLFAIASASADERAVKTIDFSPNSVADRWEAGMRDMRSGLDRLAATLRPSGLTYLRAEPEPVSAP